MTLRNRRNSGWWLAIGAVALLTALVLLVWGNYQYAKANPGGNDFLVHWVGTRGLLVDGLSPYSDETALRIQTIAYGRAALPGEHQLRVAYPLYSIVVFFPFALFGDFTFARAVWMTFLEISLLLMALIAMRITQWKPALLTLPVFLLFTFFWYHSLRPLINGNAVIFVAFLITAAFWAMRANADEMAGVLLAFTTIKPQVVVLLLVYVVIYALFNRRWRLVIWLAGTMIILVAASFFLIPDWMMQNLREVVNYPGYNPPGTPGAAMAVWLPASGHTLGLILTAIVGVTLLVQWVLSLKAEFRGFLWTACLTLALSGWSGIQTDPGNFIVAFPGLVLVFALIEERWRRTGGLMSVVTMLAIFGAIWYMFLTTLETVMGQPQQSPLMFFPLPAIMLVLLFWVRWWAFHPVNGWDTLMYDKKKMLR